MYCKESLGNDPNALWEIMSKIICQSIDSLCPLRRVTICEDQLPWISKTLRQLIALKDRHFKLACKIEANADWRAFHDLKVEVRKSFIRNKRQYIMNKLNENKNDPRHFWQEMNSNLRVGRQKSCTLCTRIKGENGHIISGDGVLTLFNNFYVCVGPKLAEKFPPVQNTVSNQIDICNQ